MKNIISLFIERIYAQDIVGEVTNPLPHYGGFDGSGGGGGLVLLVTNILRLVFVAAGIFALFNFIQAGYQYMTAAGDSKQLTAAWARIWQTLLGLIIIVGSFAAAALAGYILFGDPGFILRPKLYGPIQ